MPRKKVVPPVHPEDEEFDIPETMVPDYVPPARHDGFSMKGDGIEPIPVDTLSDLLTALNKEIARVQRTASLIPDGAVSMARLAGEVHWKMQFTCEPDGDKIALDGDGRVELVLEGVSRLDRKIEGESEAATG